MRTAPPRALLEHTAQQAREEARRARSRPMDPVDPVDPVDPSAPHTSASAHTSRPVGPVIVDPGQDAAARAAALLELLLRELALVRDYPADPLARGRVVAQLVSVALTASRAAELEAEVARLERTVARLHADRDNNRPRRLA